MSVEVQSKAEERVLRLGKRSLRKMCSWQASLLLVLLPMWFVMFGFWIWSRIEESGRFSLWLETNGHLHQVDVQVATLWKALVVVLGACLAFPILFIARLWWERRIFYGIIEKLSGLRSKDPQG